MSATVTTCIPPSKADASFTLGVTMSAMGRRFSLHSEIRRQQLPGLFHTVSYGHVQLLKTKKEKRKIARLK